MRRIGMAASLAASDWRHERWLSLCAVLALASMLAPLLVLWGVRNGVTTAMRQRLLEDPAVLVITPTGTIPGGYSPAFLDSVGALPGARFVIGRTRDIATNVSLRSTEGVMVSVQMEPCAPGEPVLEHYNMPGPEDGEQPGIVLSKPAAHSLGVGPGDMLHADLGRFTPEGRLESVTLRLVVAAVLPAEAAGGRMGFVPLAVLEDMQDYRDYTAVPRRGYTGIPREEETRRYASFRLYARDLDAVESLAGALRKQEVETRTRSREIAGIRNLEKTVSRIITVIAWAAGLGLAAFTGSSAFGSVRRKSRELGMMRLFGFSRVALSGYPLTHTVLTAVFGTLMAGLVYLAVSMTIDHAFAEQSGGVALTRLELSEFCLVLAAVLSISIVSAMAGALKAALVEPSTVIREV